MKRLLKILGVIATIGMFTVLVMGATVTNTGSAHGCGRSWPLCRGQLIPQFAVSTLIEFSHRAVVGVESVLILGLAAGTLYLYRRRDLQALAIVMVIFLFLQAGLGAWAVMYPQLAVVLALHFGVSLIAFASVLLTTIALFEADGQEALRQIPAPRAFRRLVWAVAAYSYAVVYLGALVRHIDADQACSGWPLCNGSLIPGITPSVAAAYGHRIAAGVLVLAVLAVAAWSRMLAPKRPDLYRASRIALVLVVLQGLAGAVVVFTRVDLFSALAHAAGAGLLFGSLTYLCMHCLPVPRTHVGMQWSPAFSGTSHDPTGLQIDAAQVGAGEVTGPSGG